MACLMKGALVLIYFRRNQKAQQSTKYVPGTGFYLRNETLDHGE